MTRTLKDYARHYEDCKVLRCVATVFSPRVLPCGGDADYYLHDDRDHRHFHDFAPGACSCDLDALLAECVPSEQKITRIEIIDESGRLFVEYADHIELSHQDEGRTLKAFIHGPRVAPPETTEPRKYSACRICGRGPTTLAQHIAIATYGVHTDANGKPNQPNNGTAYCDQCEDETLVAQPLPAPETETPQGCEVCGKELFQSAQKRCSTHWNWPAARSAPPPGIKQHPEDLIDDIGTSAPSPSDVEQAHRAFSEGLARVVLNLSDTTKMEAALKELIPQRDAAFAAVRQESAAEIDRLRAELTIASDIKALADSEDAILRNFDAAIQPLISRAEQAEAALSKMKSLCGAVYQMAGAAGAPVRFLDALSEAANGGAFESDGLLPVLESEFALSRPHPLDVLARPEINGKRLTPVAWSKERGFYWSPDGVYYRREDVDTLLTLTVTLAQEKGKSETTD